MVSVFLGDPVIRLRYLTKHMLNRLTNNDHNCLVRNREFSFHKYRDGR